MSTPRLSTVAACHACCTTLAMLAALLLAPAAASAQAPAINQTEDRLTVMLGDHVFTQYILEGHRTPILYPVYGPGNRPMTRNYPMEEVEGEAKDHPHHRSIFFGHMEVNGHSFWHNERIENERVHHGVRNGKAYIIAFNNWLDPDDEVVLRDVTVLTFHTIGPHRAIDYQVTLHATEGDVTFGDNKDGLMGIRTHPNLRLVPAPNQGVEEVHGQAVNSEGVENREMWGKRADWLSYWAPIEDKVVGVAMMDHPQNLRHPTWWHAREYGLISANPFGISDFEGAPEGTGDYVLEEGDSLTLLYRFVFHEGSAEEADVAGLYEQFAETEPLRWQGRGQRQGRSEQQP